RDNLSCRETVERVDARDGDRDLRLGDVLAVGPILDEARELHLDLTRYRADALILRGDLDEAERCVVEARAIGSTSDVAFEIGWRRALARVNSLRGEHGEAEPVGREALAVALETEA